MASPAEQPLPLIVAREFAANLATPLAIIDGNGTLVFFNEAAARIIGSSPGDLGEMPEEQWRQRFSAERSDGSPVELEAMPTIRARQSKAPAHETMVITTLDGRRSTLGVTAIPLLEGDGTLVGVVALFWDQPA